MNIRRLLLSLALLTQLALPALVAQPVFAADSPQAAACQSIGGTYSNGSCNTSSGKNSETTVKSAVKSFVEILSMVVGAVAIIMIIVAGFKYITAAGDSGKITSAKNTLIYALVGIAVAALAQLLVNIVWTGASNV